MIDENKICKLINEELEEANKKFPPFNSPHEGYAVIKEEVEETLFNINMLNARLADLWRQVKGNSPKAIGTVANLQTDVILLIQEAIQVGAMARKYTQSLVKTYRKMEETDE